MWEMDDTDDKISSTNLRTKKKKEINMNFGTIKTHIYTNIYIFACHAFVGF